MTQEQIEIEAQNYLNGLDLPENADKQLIVDNFKNGMAWALLMFDKEKQQWIEKACDVYCKDCEYIGCDKFECLALEKFRKAMEE